MERLLQYIKDPQKRSSVAAILFFAGIIVSTYFLFSLPHNLVFDAGMKTSRMIVFAKTYIVIALTYAFGVVAIAAATRIKKEIIVFKEKESSISTSQEAVTEKNNSTSSIDLQAFTTLLKNTKPDKLFQIGLSSICQSVQAGQGAFYLIKNTKDKQALEMKSGFALSIGEDEKIEFELNEGLVGQAAASGKSIYLDELPEGYTNAIISGLGTAPPKFLFVSPIKKDNKLRGVIEIASFAPMSEQLRKQTEEMAQLLAD
jgi:GAF domain